MTEQFNTEDKFLDDIMKLLPPASQLPTPFRQNVAIAPPKFKLPSFVATAIPTSVMATRLRFAYPFDSDEMACLLQSLLVGPQSSGKSFIRRICSTIMEKIQKRDDQQMELEQQYQELKQCLGKNRDLPEPPATTVTIIPVTISKTKLVKRAHAFVKTYGEPLTLFQTTDELGIVVDNNKRGFSDLRAILRTAYDAGSSYGQDFAGSETYSCNVDIRMSVLYSCTPNVLSEFLNDRALENGTASRFIIVPLNTEIGDAAPIFRPYTTKEKVEIDAIVQKVMDGIYQPDGTLGPEIHLDLGFLTDTVKKWCKEKSLLAVKTGSMAVDTFFKRSSVSAFRIAALCYYLYQLEGTKNCEKNVKRIYRAMAEYTLNSFLRTFGQRYDNLQSKHSQEEQPVSLSLFDNLPERFTRQELNVAIEKLCLITKDAVFISKWLKKGLIRRITKTEFEKNSGKA